MVFAAAGISALFDGRIMVTGGNTDRRTSLFDPSTGDWSIGAEMGIPRGYQVRHISSAADSVRKPTVLH